MIEPPTLLHRPWTGLLLLGGMAGTILLSGLVLVPSRSGAAFPDIPRLIGGAFTADPATAFWLGFGIFFGAGLLLFAPLLGTAWHYLPGPNVGFSAALTKGALWGAILWVLSGLLLTLLGILNRVEDVAGPGLFGLAHGPLAPVWLLLALLAYGLSVALIGEMAQGISPPDTIGWDGHRQAESREEVIP